MTTLSKGSTDAPTTLDIQRESVLVVEHPAVVAASAAFERIGHHRKLFRRDWLPFIDGVYFLSLKAWEAGGSPRNLDGAPDWSHDPVQVAFRESIAALPWADYITTRRKLLFVIRHIGQDREPFLTWYDGLDESRREKVGHPETLWGLYQRREQPPRSGEGTENEGDEDLQELVRENAELRRRGDRVQQRGDRFRQFCERLQNAVTGGVVTLPSDMTCELASLLADAPEEAAP